MTTATAIPTRERLLRSTTELIEDGGYAAASVAAIADRARVATGTLYRHFSSKADLFVEVFRFVCEREIEVTRQAAAECAGATAKLEATIQTFAARAMQNPRLAWALVAEPIDPLVDAERLAYRRSYCDHVAVIVRDGISAGEFEPQDAELSAAAIVGAIGETLVGPLSPAADESPVPQALISSLITFCLCAVSAPRSKQPASQYAPGPRVSGV